MKLRALIPTLAALMVAGISAARAQTPPSTIGTVQTLTVSPRDLEALRAATRAYLQAALDDQEAFYGAVADDYVGVNTDGKTYRAGQVFGLVQAAKLNLSGIVTRTRVIDAHHLGDFYDETAVLGGSADTIDAAGAHSTAAAWLHKITFRRRPDGTLVVTRDQVLQRI